MFDAWGYEWYEQERQKEEAFQRYNAELLAQTYKKDNMDRPEYLNQDLDDFDESEDYISDIMSRLEEDYVPKSGSCETALGEIVRAYTTLTYNMDNEGDIPFTTEGSGELLSSCLAYLAYFFSQECYNFHRGDAEEAKKFGDYFIRCAAINDLLTCDDMSPNNTKEDLRDTITELGTFIICAIKFGFEHLVNMESEEDCYKTDPIDYFDVFNFSYDDLEDEDDDYGDEEDW